MAIQPTACYTKPFDEKEVARLIELGKRHFPILLSSNRFLYDEHTRSHFIQLFDTIKNFSFQNSDIDIITKAILKFSMRADWFDFPRELSSFMLELLSVAKNKKILVPYAGLGYCVILAKVSALSNIEC